MAIGRYTYISKVVGKNALSTPSSHRKIYNAVISGRLLFKSHTTQGVERLDQVAGKFYGSASYWWIIAAASGIGWGLQIPPGTILRIPVNLAEVIAIIR